MYNSAPCSNPFLFNRGATPETVKKAFELLLSDKSVTSILLNVFGGMHHIRVTLVS